MPALPGSAVANEEAGTGLGSAGPAVRKSGPPARLVSLTDGREYNLEAAPFVLGRDAQAEVVIGSPDASRRHAEIASVPDGDVLVDLSTNGTYVNGSRVSGRHRLKALDVIRIGATGTMLASRSDMTARFSAPARRRR